MTHTRNPKMIGRKCKECRAPFEAREADVKRGWGLFCSKSCKAITQTKKRGRGKPSKYPRHDGRSPMKYRFCDDCGSPAVNGVYTASGITWHCEEHMVEAQYHPFSSEALGQD